MHGFSHMLASSLVHGVIYKLMRHMTLPEVIGMATVVLVGVYLWTRSTRAPARKYRDREDRR